MSSMRPHRQQAFGDGLEQKIAAIVAERVVNFLETVDVDEMHGKAVAAQRQGGERSLQLFDEVGAVGQPGQNVMLGEIADPSVGLLLFAGAPIPGYRRHAE